MGTLRLVETHTVTRICANPGCENTVTDEHPKVGRPSLYCDEACKRANAAKVRAARRRVQKQCDALSAQGVSVGLAPLADAAGVGRAVKSLEQLTEDLGEVGSRLRQETADWARPVRRKSPTLGVYPDRLVREGYRLRADIARALVAARKRVGNVEELDAIKGLNTEFLDVVVELGRMLGVDWDQALPPVQHRDEGDDFGD